MPQGNAKQIQNFKGTNFEMPECQENIKMVLDLALKKLGCGTPFRCLSFNYIHFAG